MRQLEQRGAERTGTTMSAKMVEQAWGLRTLIPHERKPKPKFKHLPLEAGTYPASAGIMINIKDPYAWLVSWHAWAQQAGYHGTHIPAVKDKVTFSLDDIRSVMTRFSERYRNWMTAPYTTVVLKYEEVMKNPRVLYTAIGTLLGVAPDPLKMWEKTPDLIIRPARTRMKKLPPIKYDRAYYEDKQYLDLMTQEQIDAITESTDWGLFAGLYAPLPAPIRE